MFIRAGMVILETPRKCPFVMLETDMSSIRGQVATMV